MKQNACMDASHENMFWSYFTKRKEKKHTHRVCIQKFGVSKIYIINDFDVTFD